MGNFLVSEETPLCKKCHTNEYTVKILYDCPYDSLL